MSQLKIVGGKPLNGTVTIMGAKNSLLPIMSACLMIRDIVYLHDVPQLSDLEQMQQILITLGCQVHRQGNTVKIDARNAHNSAIAPQHATKIRGSIFVMGALLARFGQVQIPYPGGCAIGNRPIDIHLSLLQQIGVKLKTDTDTINATWQRHHHRQPTILTLDMASVGATENIIQATVLAPSGNTYHIHGAAQEPEVVDLCNFLNQCGAQISGIGTSNLIITSVPNLHGITYTPITDRIVAGSYLIATAVCGGDVTLLNTNAQHNLNLINKLQMAGAQIITTSRTIRIIMHRPHRIKWHIHTAPYPGFSTDLQSQLAVLATVTPGCVWITENLFENRFRYASELTKLGAQITTNGNQALIKGVKSLHPSLTPLYAQDLRGSVALVIAALKTPGVTIIEHAEYLSRGHADIVKDLRLLGASVCVLPPQIVHHDLDRI